MKPILTTLIILTLFTACKHTNTEADTVDKNTELITEQDANPALTEAQTIALKNGITAWDKVKEIGFTFNVDRNGNNVARRSWLWKPKTQDVVMIINGDTIAYNRKRIDSTAIAADRGFINDKFWLLAPYQLVWDTGATITVQDTATAPISKKTSRKLTILYGNEGGYTPGDAYDFYYNQDYIIDEWVFRKANAKSASMTTTFEAYKNIAGLNIASSHKGLANDLHLYFTDITVK